MSEREHPADPYRQCCGILAIVVDDPVPRCARPGAATIAAAPARRSRRHHHHRSPRPPELHRRPEPESANNNPLKRNGDGAAGDLTIVRQLRSGCWRSRPPSSGAAAAKGPEPAPPVSARRPRSSQIEIGGGRPGPKLGPDSAPPPRARGIAKRMRAPHRVVASPPSAKLTPWLGRAGHHPIKPKRNRRRRGLQLGHNPAPRSAPPRQGIKSTIPPARNLGARTRRRLNVSVSLPRCATAQYNQRAFLHAFPSLTALFAMPRARGGGAESGPSFGPARDDRKRG